MSSPGTKKGTTFENHIRDTYLRPIWPKAERAPKRGIMDRGDFDHCNGYIVEAKHRKRWDIGEWIRTVLRKQQRHDPAAPWVIVFAGDKRTAINMDLVVMPAEQYFHQLKALVSASPSATLHEG